MKTEVYSWRLSSALKSELERKARLRKVPISAVLDSAVRDWLKNGGSDGHEDEEQRRLQEAAASCIGILAGHNPHRAENARQNIRARLKRRNAR